jgi:PAS domain S-box-containing protein
MTDDSTDLAPAPAAWSVAEHPSECARLISAIDWAETSLGAFNGWPPELRTLIQTMLDLPLPSFVIWGRERLLFYNDGLIPALGAAHPVIGRPALTAVAAENAASLAPLFQRAYAGHAIRSQDIAFANQSLSLTPIRDSASKVMGLIGILHPLPRTLKKRSGMPTGPAELQQLNDHLLRSERALRDREAELARVQQIANVGGLTVDLLNGFRNDRSPEYLAIHGLPADAKNETHEEWVQRVHPDDRDRAEREFLDAVAGTSNTYASQYRIIRRSDGETRWVAVRAQLERNADGRAIRLVGAHIDITDRMLVQESLRESEQRFRLIADSAPVPIWVSKLNGQRAFANQAYLDFLGVGYEEALVYDWRKALHPDDLDRILRDQVVGESSLQPFVLEARYRRVDGEWRWLRSESQPRFDPLGKHVGFIGVAHDITLAKQAEEELRRINDALAGQVARRTRERDQIWNVSQDLLLVLRTDGCWLTVNPAWTTHLGWTEQELLGEQPASTPEFEQARDKLTSRLLDAPNAPFDSRLGHRDGSLRWISWTSAADEDTIYAVGRDVTAEREAQDTLRRTEEALRQSQKLEAMGQLTGGVAHDFNNLLMPIIGSLDMLQRRGLGTEREQRLIGGALNSAERAKTLVHRLLAFARRQPLQPVAVDVGQLVLGMAELIESTTGPQIKVAVEVSPEIAPAKADPNQLEMAILNLAVNARDAMPHGGTLRISAATQRVSAGHRAQLSPGHYVHLSVADTGTGMSEDVIARAIEPFFSTKGIGKGTGLGLSMVHGLAVQLGGALTISSKLSMGTNVELWLPVSDAAAEAPEVDSSELPLSSGSVLLVDDEDVVRMSTADMLLELGFTVHEANSGEAALRFLDRGIHLDLLVTDHLMPGMTGVELATQFRMLRPRAPVLVISGFAEAEGIALNLPRLTKPFRQADLAASIAGLMSASGPPSPEQRSLG